MESNGLPAKVMISEDTKLLVENTFPEDFFF